MNAKARKKEKRRAERTTLQTTTATENAALDAATPSAKQPSKTPASETSSLRHFDATHNYTPDEDQRILINLLPRAFAAGVTARLEATGQPPPTKVEVAMLSGLMESYILQAMETGILQMRDLRKGKRPDEAGHMSFNWSWSTDHTQGAKDEASTQDPETTKREVQQDSVQPGQQPLEGSARDNADQANATTTEEKGLWDIAAEKATLEGGSTLKIYKAMKKKLKAKERKQAVAAA